MFATLPMFIDESSYEIAPASAGSKTRENFGLPLAECDYGYKAH